MKPSRYLNEVVGVDTEKFFVKKKSNQTKTKLKQKAKISMSLNHELDHTNVG